MSVREMILVSMFAALASAGGLLLRFGGEAVVPFSILPLITLFAGVFLGGRLGALSMAIYMLIGFIGVPVFAKAPFGGLVYFVNPTAGFLFGFVGAAYATGKIAEKIGRNSIWAYLAACAGGLVVLYLIGLPYLYVVLNYYLGKALDIWSVIKIGFVPFIGFDLIKAIIVSIIAVPVVRQVTTGKNT